MLRFIKILLNAFILVLAVIGFNAIGGQKYTENITLKINEFIQQITVKNLKSLGDFSNLHEEFQIDNAINLFGYKGLLAEHKASGQKLCIIDSGTKPLLKKSDITNKNLELKLTELSSKFKYQSISFKEIKVLGTGKMNVYGQNVPYAKVEAKSNRLPLSDISGIVACVQTSDGSEKLIISLAEKKKYSQLIANEFFKNVKEHKK